MVNLQIKVLEDYIRSCQVLPVPQGVGKGFDLLMAAKIAPSRPVRFTQTLVGFTEQFMQTAQMEVGERTELMNSCVENPYGSQKVFIEREEKNSGGVSGVLLTLRVGVRGKSSSEEKTEGNLTIADVKMRSLDSSVSLIPFLKKIWLTSF